MKWIAIGLISLYKLCLSPFMGDCCRFFPSCSEYALQAFKEKGFFSALWLSLSRVLKCNPWHPGGHDPL